MRVLCVDHVNSVIHENAIGREMVSFRKSSSRSSFVVRVSISCSGLSIFAIICSPWSSNSDWRATAAKTRRSTTSYVPLLYLCKHLTHDMLSFAQVAINASKRRDAQPLEKLGEYDPIPRPPPPASTLASAIANSFHLASRAPSAEELALGKRGEKKIVWDVERVRYWLGVGAQPTESVVKLLERVSSPFFCSSWCPYGVFSAAGWRVSQEYEVGDGRGVVFRRNGISFKPRTQRNAVG